MKSLLVTVAVSIICLYLQLKMLMVFGLNYNLDQVHITKGCLLFI
ncbi:hypothetical protein VPHF99_0129 [Vibrio phage F99]